MKRRYSIIKLLCKLQGLQLGDLESRMMGNYHVRFGNEIVIGRLLS